jgi:hypothetical protein
MTSVEFCRRPQLQHIDSKSNDDDLAAWEPSQFAAFLEMEPILSLAQP